MYMNILWIQVMCWGAAGQNQETSGELQVTYIIYSWFSPKLLISFILQNVACMVAFHN